MELENVVLYLFLIISLTLLQVYIEESSPNYGGYKFTSDPRYETILYNEIDNYYKESMFKFFGGFTPDVNYDFKSLSIRFCNKQVQFLKALYIIFNKLFVNQDSLDAATIVALTQTYTTGTLLRESFVDLFYFSTNFTYNYTGFNFT